MSARTSRKRTTTQRLGGEGNGVAVKDEPQGDEEGKEDGRKRRREGARPIGAGQTQRGGQQKGDDEEGNVTHSMNPFLPLHSLNKPGNPPLTMGEMKVSDIVLSERQQAKWDRVSDAQKAQMVKAVVRLLLFKGSINDKISYQHLKDALARINTICQTHSQAALREAQKHLKETFGFNVETVKTEKDSISSIFVINDMRSPALQTILSQHRTSMNDSLLAGYRGFCHLVFVSIWTSPGRVIDMLQLLRNVRKVDPRFSESIEGQGGGTKKQSMALAVRSGSGIEELGGLGFPALVQRMVKEGYLKETKDAVDSVSIGKRQISFGPRFFVEVGLKQLARSYFVATGVPEDQAVLQELDRERKGFISGNMPDDDDEGEEDQDGHEEQKGHN